MRSRLYKRPLLTASRASSGSRPCWLIRPGNGSPPTGRYVRSARRPRHTEWGRLSPMLGAMPCSRSSALLERTILMRRTLQLLHHHSSGVGFGETGQTNGSGRACQFDAVRSPQRQGPSWSAEAYAIRSRVGNNKRRAPDGSRSAQFSRNRRDVGRSEPYRSRTRSQPAMLELVEEAFRSRMTALELPSGEGGTVTATAEA